MKNSSLDMFSITDTKDVSEIHGTHKKNATKAESKEIAQIIEFLMDRTMSQREMQKVQKLVEGLFLEDAREESLKEDILKLTSAEVCEHLEGLAMYLERSGVQIRSLADLDDILEADKLQTIVKARECQVLETFKPDYAKEA